MTIDEIRDAYRVREGYWFAPKLFGFGATPVTWQGWAISALFAAALVADLRWLPTSTARLIVALALAVGFTAIAVARTDGGWHWRWGRR